MEQNENLAAVATAATLFTRLDEEDYRAIVSEDSWHHIAKALGISDSPPGFESYRHFANHGLTPGMRLAALPVESLYLPWSELPDAQGGNVRGHYRGDHAVHIEELCTRLGIGIPPEFRAMPDHLALLAELLAFLDEHAPAPEARAFARDHFAWLPYYIDALRIREAHADDIDLAKAFEFYANLTIGIRETIRIHEKEGGTE